MNIPAKIRQVFKNATCLYSKQEVESAFDAMAEAIHNELSESNPILLTVLKGGMVLTGNLLPRLDFPLEIDNIYASRYQGALEGRQLVWKYEPSVDLKDRVVLIVDDILDVGLTLQAIVDYCYSKNCKKVYTAVLLDKTINRPEHALKKADFTGLIVHDAYVFGYGLDYKEYLRNAPGIYETALEDQN